MTRTLSVILLLTGLSSASFPYVYHFVSESMTWEDAQIYCTSKHRALAQVNNMQNLTAMMNASTGGFTGKAWIGLTQTLSWTWDNGQIATYFNWIPGQPDNINGNAFCATMFMGYWNDVSCSETKPVVCSDGLNIIIGLPMTRASADTYCMSQASSVVKITDDLTNAAVLKKMIHKFISEAWIGLQKTQVWHWSEVSENNEFRYWQQGQPDNLNEENCAAVMVKNGTWSNEQCNTKYPFFCYDLYKLWSSVVMMTIQSAATLEDPASRDDLLQQLYETFANHGVTDIKLNWRQVPMHETPEKSTIEDPYCSSNL